MPHAVFLINLLQDVSTVRPLVSCKRTLPAVMPRTSWLNAVTHSPSLRAGDAVVAETTPGPTSTLPVIGASSPCTSRTGPWLSAAWRVQV